VPTVLVVDDSAVDRSLVSGLLAKDTTLKIRNAIHGADAMRQIEESPPDIVVTDLIMPEMSGLELVAAVKAKYPSVPVVLMTSKGSEDVAARALHQGAASYVPKRMLAQRILRTVRGVLSAGSRLRRYERLMGCVARNECSFVLDNDCSMFGDLVGYLQECVVSMGLFDEVECTRVGVALEEALANAFCHGNLQIDSSLRDEDDEAYGLMIRQRRAQPPYRDRKIHVDVLMLRDEAVFTIRDEGEGFDPHSLPDPTDPANLEKASGRGVLLMRAFMDSVEYNELGNAVTLIKRRGTPADGAASEDS